MPGPSPKHYLMSEIKQKLMRPAQTSVYMVNVQTNRNVNTFAGNVGRGYSKSQHEEKINMACCEASLPGSSLATHEVNNDYHGVTEKMVYRRLYDDTIDLTFYVDHEYQVIKYFQSWMNYIVGEGSFFSSDQFRSSSTFHRIQWPDSYKSSIFLTKFEKDISGRSSRPTLEYEFVGAFPINMVSIPVSYEASDLLKLTVSFSYTRYVLSYVGSGGGGSSSSGESTTGVPDVGVTSNYGNYVPLTEAEQSLYNSAAWNSDFNFGASSSPIATNYNDAPAAPVFDSATGNVVSTTNDAPPPPLF